MVAVISNSLSGSSFRSALALGPPPCSSTAKYERLAITIVLPADGDSSPASIIWRQLFSYQPPGSVQLGLLNALWTTIPGNEPLAWLQTPILNSLCLIFVALWASIGVATLIISAAVKNVPSELIDAATIDGALPSSTPPHSPSSHHAGIFSLKGSTLSSSDQRNFDRVPTLSQLSPPHLGHASAIAVILLFVAADRRDQRPPVPARDRQMSAATQRRWSPPSPGHFAASIVVHILVVLFMVIWFTPILGLFVSSLRPQSAMRSGGGPSSSPCYRQLPAGHPYVACSTRPHVARHRHSGDRDDTLLSAIGAYAYPMDMKGRTVCHCSRGDAGHPATGDDRATARLFVLVGLNGKVPAVWIYQVGFTCPSASSSFVASSPPFPRNCSRALLDGATVQQIFRLIVLPLCAPILASLAILQFLWSWNDLLIPLIFLGGSQMAAPITVEAAGIATTNGQDQTVLMAATVLSVLLPLAVVLSMQRYFVRGILGGAVKG